MVTTRRGRNTATTKPAPKQSKKKQVAEGKASATAPASKGSKKRAAPESPQKAPSAADDALKKQKVGSTVVAEDDPVAPQVPQEASDTTAAADIPTGAGTAMAAEDVEPSGAATAEPDVPAESTAGSTEPAAGATAGATTGESTTPAAAMPISEAVKYIGGTKAGSSTVSQQPTAHKAIDAVPVGPDPIAAGTTTRPTSAGTAGAGTTGTGFTTAGATAATAGATATGNGGAQPDEGNTDGDHFLDAALADSNMGDEESQPAHQVPASTGTTDATKTGFLAPSAAEQAAATEGGMAGGAEGGMVAGHGIAAAAAAEPTDIPSGLSADSQAVGPDPLAGATAATVSIPALPPTSAPTTASAHDSLFGGAAVQSSSDVPPMFGGDQS